MGGEEGREEKGRGGRGKGEGGEGTLRKNWTNPALLIWPTDESTPKILTEEI